jgi:hypothetical protein
MAAWLGLEDGGGWPRMLHEVKQRHPDIFSRCVR